MPNSLFLLLLERYKRAARCIGGGPAWRGGQSPAELVPIVGYDGRLVRTQERMGLILGRGCMGLAWLDRGPAHTAKDRRGVGCPAVLVEGGPEPLLT